MSEGKRSIKYMPLSEIRGATANAKLHDAAALGQSMKRFGFTEAPTLDERTQRLVAGHGRLEMLSALKAKGKKAPPGIEVREDGEWLVPVQRGWSSRDDIEARAYVLASNKTSEAGGWDEDKLGAELAAIADDAMLSLLGTGFDDVDLAKLVDDGERAAGRKGGRGVQGDVFQVLIDVADEAAQVALIERLEREGFKCRPLMF